MPKKIDNCVSELSEFVGGDLVAKIVLGSYRQAMSKIAHFDDTQFPAMIATSYARARSNGDSRYVAYQLATFRNRTEFLASQQTAMDVSENKRNKGKKSAKDVCTRSTIGNGSLKRLFETVLFDDGSGATDTNGKKILETIPKTGKSEYVETREKTCKCADCQARLPALVAKYASVNWDSEETEQSEVA